MCPDELKDGAYFCKFLVNSSFAQDYSLRPTVEPLQNEPLL